MLIAGVALVRLRLGLAQGRDEVASERVMAVGCLTWTSGFAIGGAIGGIPETTEGVAASVRLVFAP